MHDTAYKYCQLFYNTYIKNNPLPTTVVDIGSLDVNGSVKPIFSKNPLITYIGIDYEAGAGVDVMMTDPYKVPLADNSVDVIVTSSCFEHVELFWVLYLELMRVLKPTGLLYINAPSNGGAYHRHPVDCWRFNTDAGPALAKWGQHNGYNCALLESFIGTKMDDIWLDFTSVFIKDQQFVNLYPNRIINSTIDYMNARYYNSETIINHQRFQE
jgi:SAM-dependent methyltransferase